MGNCQTCCNPANNNEIKEAKAKKLNIDPQRLDKIKFLSEIPQDEDDIHVTNTQINQNDVLTFQKAETLSFNPQNNPQLIQPEYVILEEFPKLTDHNVMLTNIKLGPFQWQENLNKISQYKDMSEVIVCKFLKSKIVFKGHLINGLKSGECECIWPDGSYYQGYMLNGLAHFYGRLIHNTGDAYEGEFVEDQPNGEGVYYKQDGAFYVGHWENNKKDGYGKEQWPDNSSYAGYFSKDKKHGYGRYNWPDGSFYVGEFNNDQFNGKGQYRWSNKQEYDGEWLNNKMHGEGIFTSVDGKKYIGSFINGKKHGYGTLIHQDASKYQGEWYDNCKHGKGKFIDSTGQETEGIWENGKLQEKKNEEIQNIDTKTIHEQDNQDQQIEEDQIGNIQN